MHIDPFAPGDSPQHPANWLPDVVAPRGHEVSQRIEDAAANLYQWRRDHFASAAEAEQAISPEELEDRHVRYSYLFDEYGDNADIGDMADVPEDAFTPQPALLRRSVWHDLEDTEIDDWKRLFELHATDDERDPAWVDKPLPDLAELRSRARAADLGTASPEQEEPQGAQDGPVHESTPDWPEVPKSTALKEDWVRYALEVAQFRGEELSEEDANKLSVAAIKQAYKRDA